MIDPALITVTQVTADNGDIEVTAEVEIDGRRARESEILAPWSKQETIDEWRQRLINKVATDPEWFIVPDGPKGGV